MPKVYVPKVYVVGESWCPFTQEAWKIKPEQNMNIEKVDCGTCNRLEDTTYFEGKSYTRKTTSKDCKQMCDGSFGYPAYLVKSKDNRKMHVCGHGFNNENASMEKIRYCLKLYGLK